MALELGSHKGFHNLVKVGDSNLAIGFESNGFFFFEICPW